MSCLVLLILLCHILGLFYGFCGKRPGNVYGDDCCNTGTGANWLIAAVYLTFLFSLVTIIQKSHFFPSVVPLNRKKDKEFFFLKRYQFLFLFAGHHDGDDRAVPRGIDVRQSRLWRRSTSQQLRRFPVGRQTMDSAFAATTVSRYFGMTWIKFCRSWKKCFELRTNQSLFFIDL